LPSCLIISSSYRSPLTLLPPPILPPPLAVLTLLISITFRAVLTNLSNPSRLHSGNVLIITSSPYDAAFSFPLVALAFLSQFNMLSVHASLKDPTRPRVTSVINGSIATCTALFLLFGAAGYMYALGETRDNIILNFEPDDKVVLVGKMGLGVTIMAGVSMIVLPCREALMSLPRKVRKYGRRGGKGKKLRPVGEETRLLDRDDTFDDEVGTGGHKNVPYLDLEDEVDTLGVGSGCGAAAHFLVTLGITAACYMGASFCPGVSTVWSICGSSLGFVIAYILPSACYLKVRQKRKGWNMRVVGAWVMLVVSSMGMTLCTVQAVTRLFNGGVKTQAGDFVEDFYDDDEEVVSGDGF
jgi:hypothetical protein